MSNRIAIIEDDHAIAEMYAIKLRHLGYDVAIALDGDEGIQLIAKHKPQLILLDLMLPGITGDVVLQKVRNTPHGKSLRVIILTNVSQDEAPKKLTDLQVDRYIVKAHHTPSQVGEIIREVLDKA